MKDKSFLNLITDENMSKINIDPRLIESFKRVMNTIQEYFNANGYTEQRDYQAFFNEYLLNPDNSKNLSILMVDEIQKGTFGYYTSDGKKICINSSIEKNDWSLDATLCHEFIHFLVMRGLINNNLSEAVIRNGGFINEALTEMLTKQMYPYSNSYEPQVQMMKFANLLCNKVNNYSLFLKGEIDAKGYGASAWNNFVTSVERYQKKWANNPVNIYGAINNELYIEAQRNIIESKIQQHLISSFDEYTSKLNILMQRPSPDNIYIRNFINKMDDFLISNLGLKDTPIVDNLKNKLKEYRKIIENLNTYENNDIYEFNIGGRKIAIDKNRKLYNYIGSYSATWNANTGIYLLEIGNNKIELDMNNIDFKKWKNKELEKQKEIAKYFSNTTKDDIKAISQFAVKNGLKRIEKISLPIINSNKTSTIYVAIYDNEIEILGNPTKIENIKNINLFEYIGVTSLDSKIGAINSKSLGNLESGIIFSKYNKNFLENKMLYEYSKNLSTTLSLEQINNIINQYKQSNEFDIDDELTEKQIQEFALKYYAKQNYLNMSKNDQHKMFYEFAKKQEQFIISTKNGKIFVASLFNNHPISAFKGKSEILYDHKNKGLYNNMISLLENTKVNNSTINLPINENGCLIINNEKQENSNNTKYNEQLKLLQSKSILITKQIEKLKLDNKDNLISSYQEKLSSLLQEKSRINNEIEKLNESIKNISNNINIQDKQNHKQIIELIEKLFSIKITGNFNNNDVFKNNLNINKNMNLKDKLTLRNEQSLIRKKIDKLYDDGKLDIKTWRTMKLEVDKEFDLLVSKAPTPIIENNNQEEVENELRKKIIMEKYGLDEYEVDRILKQHEILKQNQEENIENIDEIGRRIR